MSSIKDRNGVDLTEAEDIKKRWQEYTEELYKKDLHDPDNHDGVITDLEPLLSYTFFLDMCPGVGLLDHMATLVLVFEELVYIFHSDCTD